jgi:hypothetical protein
MPCNFSAKPKPAILWQIPKLAAMRDKAMISPELSNPDMALQPI